MIDINKMRRLALDGDLAAMQEIILRLEAAESECLEQARLNGMGGEREAALMAKLEAAEKSDAESLTMYRKARDERDALRVELNEIRYGTAVAHDTIKALNARIEAAEKERDWHAERCEDAMNECAALRAKIEAMERQDCSKQSMPAEVSREFVMDAIAQALGDAYDCTRVWSAWGYGTMSHDDFQLIAEDGDRLREIADAAIMAMGASAPKPCAQPTPSVPDAWLPVPEKHPTFDLVDLQLSDGSVLCGCVPQSDGDYWWEGPSGEVFIDPKYASVTHWRLAAAPEAKP